MVLVHLNIKFLYLCQHVHMCTCTNTNTNMYEGDACTCKIDESPLLLTCVVMTIQVECALGGHNRHRHTGTQAHYLQLAGKHNSHTGTHVQHLCTGMQAHYPHAQQAQRGSHVQHLRTGRPQVVPQQQVNTAGCPQMIQPTVTYLRNTLKHITFAYIWTRLYVHKV